MKYRALDLDGDYTLGKNKFLEGREAVKQAVITRLRLLYGEWWENTEDGLPLFEKILVSYGGDEARQAVDIIISERILGTNGITEIISFESSIENRKYSAHCTVNTIYGETQISLSGNSNQVTVSF